MGETKKAEFEKVLSAKDILVIAFGAMIGWGWVVSTGDWIELGGVVGAMLGFVIGGIMIFFVGLTYAELTSAMPQTGGEHVFSFKAMGPVGSFICTWAIILGYVSVVCFEACALPTIITYIYPDFLQGYLYTIGGFDIYLSWLCVAIGISIFITVVNIIGTKTAAILQTVLTIVIGGVGILLMAAAAVTGSTANLENQLFMGATTTDMIKGTLAVAVMTPFYFIGFNVIPQAAEEISVSLQKIGQILMLSIVLAVLFYALIILGVGYVLNNDQVVASMQSVGGLVTADAMAQAFSSSMMAKVLIIGGLCGIITSWNSFLIGGSRAMYSMAQSYMIPRMFAKIDPKYKTPINALLLIGLLSVMAPFFGKKMLVWVVNAGNFGCCLAYCMVSISFVILRRKEPNLNRPYKVRHYKVIGALAILMSGFMVMMYLIPGSGASLVTAEWAMVAGWAVLGALFGLFGKWKYGSRFATHIERSEEPRSDRDEAFGRAMAAVRKDEGQPGEEAIERPLQFSLSLPENIVFGKGKVHEVGQLVQAYGTQALVMTDLTTPGDNRDMMAVVRSLQDQGITYRTLVYSVTQREDMTIAAVQRVRQEAYDMIIAIGSAVVMEEAKYIALQDEREKQVSMPLIYVPTELLMLPPTNREGIVPEKTTWRHAQPDMIILDPDCVDHMGQDEKCLVGYGALCHLSYAYTAATAQPLTDALALYGLETLCGQLPSLRDAEPAAKTWEAIVLGTLVSYLIGCGTGNPLGQMIRTVCGRTGAPDVLVLAAMYPLIWQETYLRDVFRSGHVARLLGGLVADDGASCLRSLRRQLGLDEMMTAAGLTPDRVEKWVKAYLNHSGSVRNF